MAIPAALPTSGNCSSKASPKPQQHPLQILLQELEEVLLWS